MINQTTFQLETAQVTQKKAHKTTSQITTTKEREE